MQKEEYRKKFFDLLNALKNNYWIEIAGERKSAEAFEDENKLWEFTTADDIYYPFIIGKTFQPTDAAITKDNIVATLKEEFEKLIPLYTLLKDDSFEG